MHTLGLYLQKKKTAESVLVSRTPIPRYSFVFLLYNQLNGMLETLFYASVQIGIAVLIARPAGAILGIVGAPGILMAQRFHKYTVLFRMGLCLATLAEVYVLLAFGVALIYWNRSVLSSHPSVHGWALWSSSFVATALPAWIICLSSLAHVEDDWQAKMFLRPYLTVEQTAKIVPFGFLVLILFPSVMARGWGWVGAIHPLP
jgi:F0F1-type ATP synthase membrane subunit c/vacuolar-type H+-ATPase subunit K